MAMEATTRPRKSGRSEPMELVDLGNAPDDEARLSEFLDQVCSRLEVDYAAYAGTNPMSGKIHGFVNYPGAWKAHYAERGLARIDPTLIIASRSIAPVDWTRIPRDAMFEAVFREAFDFGISDNGITVPVRGPYGDIGMLSVTRKGSAQEWAKVARNIVTQLQSFAVHLHDSVMQTDEMSRLLRHPQLSKREIEVLQWIAAGKTYGDVGEILSISDRTVEVHLRSAREKLRALTTTQAVARAIKYGFIYPL